MPARLRLLLLSAAVSLLAGIALANNTGTTLATKLVPALPTPWAVVERNADVLPQGHYWGQEYTGVRGEELVLQGSADVHISWQDANGDWHSENVGKEALRLYVMPSTYRESLLRFFIPKRPVAARLLAETPSFKVYAFPSTRILEKEKVDHAVKHGRAIRWPDSPESTGALSWVTWSVDIPGLITGR